MQQRIMSPEAPRKITISFSSIILPRTTQASALGTTHRLSHLAFTMFVSKDELRARFCSALSAMYRTEVPLYGDLVELVDDINAMADGQPEGV
jgi:hypothetical protein